MKIVQETKNIFDDWQQVKLGDISHVIMGQSPSSIAYNIDGVGLPLIQGNNDIKKRKTISRVCTSEITKTVEAGDIVLTVRAPVGLVGIATEKVCIGRGVCGIQTKNASKDFIFKFLEYFEPKWGTLEQGSTFTAVNSSDIRKLELSLPPLREQNRIVVVLEMWDKLIEKLTKKIELKKRIKKGLMQNLLTGKMRLSGFKDKWIKLKIRDIGKVVTGNTPSKKKPEYYDGEYLWATAFDFCNVYIEDTQIKLSELGKTVSRVVPIGSILVTCIASIGKNAIAKKPMSFNQQINAIIPNEKYNSEFIYYLIENSLRKLKEVAGGGALAMINKSVFESIMFEFPNFDEQNAIADILTTSDREIELLENKLQQIKQQKRYLLNNLITGAIRTPENLN